MGMDGDGRDGSSKSAESAVTGQSGRQKSVGDPCASSFEFECEFGGLLTEMALKRTFAKVIVKMPSQIP